MPPFRAILVLIAAITISFFAAYMSIEGMYALFPAAGWVIIGSMIGVEFAKLVAAEAVHAEWTTGLLNRAKKVYLCTAIGALMAITAMGVYGFLAKGHLEQAAPLAPVQLQIAQKDARLGQLREELGRLTTQQNQSNAAVDNILKNTTNSRDARAGLRARNQAGAERKELQTKIDQINTEMNAINQELVPLKMQVAEVNTKLGPLQYVADLFGWKDPEAAVRLIILLLMFAFDPLAIVLMIVGTNIWARWSRERKAAKLAPVEAPAEPESTPVDNPVEEEPAAVEEPAVEKGEEEVFDRNEMLRAIREQVARERAEERDGWAVELDHREIKPSMTEVLRELELRPHEPEAPKKNVYAEDTDLTEDDLRSVLDGDAAVFVPSPQPGSWGYVTEPSPLLAKAEEPEAEPVHEWRMTADEAAAEPENLLLELEETLQKKTDAEQLVEIVEEHPELIDEVAEILEEDPELLDEVAKAAEEPKKSTPNGWLDTTPKGGE